MQDNHNKQRAMNIQETETQETGRCVTGKVDNGNGDTVVIFFSITRKLSIKSDDSALSM